MFPIFNLVELLLYILCPQQRKILHVMRICLVCCQVIMQLEACGIVETIHISAAGFPIRWNIFSLLNSSSIAAFLSSFIELVISFCAEFLLKASFNVMDWFDQNTQGSTQGLLVLVSTVYCWIYLTSNLACFLWGKQWFYFLSLGLLVYSPFTTLVLLVNLLLSSMLSLGTFQFGV